MITPEVIRQLRTQERLAPLSAGRLWTGEDVDVLLAAHEQAERALAEARAEGVHQQHKYAEAADEISALRTQLHAAQEALRELTTRFQDQRRLLNKYEAAPGFHERVEARAAAYHDEACSYQIDLIWTQEALRLGREHAEAMRAIPYDEGAAEEAWAKFEDALAARSPRRTV